MMNALSIDEAALDVNNKPRKTGYDTKVKAKAAAVATIGEHARDGFEFETFKAGGRWHWRVFDVVKPPTAAEIKAMGGRRAFSKEELTRHEQRGAERAAGEGRLRVEPETSLVAMAQQISGGMAVTIEVAAEKPRPAPRKPRSAPKAPEAPVEPSATENAPLAITPLSRAIKVGDTVEGPGAPPEWGGKPGKIVAQAAGDGLDLPEFLKRPKQTEEEKEAVRKRMAKTTGPERVIKNPPNVKQAKAKAKKRTAGSKTALIGSMLLDPKGCTAAEVLKATGWPAVGMPAQAKACGLKLRKVKDGKVTRYFGSK